MSVSRASNSSANSLNNNNIPRQKTELSQENKTRLKIGLTTVAAFSGLGLGYWALQRPSSQPTGWGWLPASIIIPVAIGLVLKGRSYFQPKEKTPKTVKESLQYLWNLNQAHLSYLQKKDMPDLSPEDMQKLHDIFKNIESELNESDDKKIDNSLISITDGLTKNTLQIDLKIKEDFDEEKKEVIYTYGEHPLNLTKNDFKHFLKGFILSQEKSFFAVLDGLGRGTTENNFLIFPNKNCKTDDDLIGLSNGIPLMTREGLVSPKGAEWQIGEDSICRLVKKNSPEEKAKEKEIKYDLNEIKAKFEFFKQIENNYFHESKIISDEEVKEINEIINYVDSLGELTFSSSQEHKDFVSRVSDFAADIITTVPTGRHFGIGNRIYHVLSNISINHAVHMAFHFADGRIPEAKVIVDQTIKNEKLKIPFAMLCAEKADESQAHKEIAEKIWNQCTDEQKITYLIACSKIDNDFCQNKLISEKDRFLKTEFSQNELSLLESCLKNINKKILNGNKAIIFTAYKDLYQKKKGLAEYMAGLYTMLSNAYTLNRIPQPLDKFDDILPKGEDTIALVEFYFNVIFSNKDTPQSLIFGYEKYKLMEILLKKCKNNQDVQLLYRKFLGLIKNDPDKQWNKIAKNFELETETIEFPGQVSDTNGVPLIKGLG